MDGEEKCTFKMAFCAMMSSFGIFLMFLSNFLPFFEFIICILVGLLIIMIAQKTDLKWAAASYFVICVGSLLLIDGIFQKLVFATFYGIYPLVFLLISKLKVRNFLKFTIKILFFNVVTLLNIFLLKEVMLFSTTRLLCSWWGWLMVLFLNFFCLAYDRLLVIANKLNFNKVFLRGEGFA